MKFGDNILTQLLAIGLVVPLFLLWIVAYVDVARRKDLRFTRKVFWAVAIFLGVYIGIAAYFMMRPVAPVIGKGTRATAPRSSRLVADLESLKEGHTDGAITDDDYLAKKRNLLGLT